MHNIIIVGTGSIASIYIEIITREKLFNIIAIVSDVAERRRDISTRYGIKTISYADFYEDASLLVSTDGIVIANSEWMHFDLLKHLHTLHFSGKILAEKPLVSNDAELDELSGYKEDFLQHITVVHSLRLSPRFYKARQLIKSGSIGNVINVYNRRNPPLSSFARVKEKFSLEYWILCHDIDLMQWILGSTITELQAFGTLRYDTPGSVTVFMKNRDNVSITHEFCYASPGNSSRRILTDFWGSEGVLHIDDTSTNMELVTANTFERPDTYEDFAISENATRGLFREVIVAWHDEFVLEIAVLPKALEALQVMKICSAIKYSVDNPGEIIML
jgi:predicted dehydrogenase